VAHGGDGPPAFGVGVAPAEALFFVGESDAAEADEAARAFEGQLVEGAVERPDRLELLGERVEAERKIPCGDAVDRIFVRGRRPEEDCPAVVAQGQLRAEDAQRHTERIEPVEAFVVQCDFDAAARILHHDALAKFAVEVVGRHPALDEQRLAEDEGAAPAERLEPGDGDLLRPLRVERRVIAELPGLPAARGGRQEQQQDNPQTNLPDCRSHRAV